MISISPPFLITGEVYGTLIDCLIHHESGGNKWAWNKKDPFGGAKGILQFLQPTFDYFAPKAGITNPNIWNEEHQRKTADYMLSQGLLNQWTCGRKCDIYDIK